MVPRIGNQNSSEYGTEGDNMSTTVLLFQDISTYKYHFPWGFFIVNWVDKYFLSMTIHWSSSITATNGHCGLLYEEGRKPESPGHLVCALGMIGALIVVRRHFYSFLSTKMPYYSMICSQDEMPHSDQGNPSYPPPKLPHPGIRG